MTEENTWEDAVRYCVGEPSFKALARDSYFGGSVHEAERYHASQEFASLLALLPSPGVAVEIGAGSGILAYALAKEGWKVIAVEPDGSDLVGCGAIRGLAEHEKLPITVVQSTAENLEELSYKADLVVARQAMHHANELGDFCSQMARIADLGAMVVTLRDHVVDDPSQLDEFFRIHPLHHLYGGEWAYSIEQYEAALRSAGLQIQKRLAPYSHAINLAPRELSHLKSEIAARYGPISSLTRLMLALIPARFVGKILDKYSSKPGRLYSWVCVKAEGSR